MIPDIYSLKHSFYNGAIKTRIQLIWMQDWAMKIALWLTLFVNLSGATLFLIAYLVVEDRSQILSRTDSPIVLAAALFPFAMFYLAAVYSMGLLIYRHRVRWAVRRQATIVPQYDLSLSPLEAAALIGHAGYMTEAWHLLYRLVQTGNVAVIESADGTGELKRIATDASAARLKWYERLVIDDIFIVKEQYEQRLQKSMNPARLAALTGLHYDKNLPLSSVRDRMGEAYLSHLNSLIRTRLINDGFFRQLGVVGVWLQTLLYVMMLTLPFFSFLFSYIMIDTIPWQGASLQFSVPMTAMIIAGYALGIVVCMMWFLSTNIYTRFGFGKYVEAEGLRLYIDAAMKDRLRSGAVSSKEMAYFMPYAQMMGLVDGDEERERAVLVALGKR
jgi:hypothetical protein